MKKKTKRIAAWIGIFILVALYAATLILSFLDFPGAGRLFQASLAATIGMPILLWIYIWLYEKITKKE